MALTIRDSWCTATTGADHHATMSVQGEYLCDMHAARKLASTLISIAEFDPSDEAVLKPAAELLYKFAARARLEALRAAIRAESISYGELAELQALAPYIEGGDTELAEWAARPEDEFRER